MSDQHLPPPIRIQGACENNLHDINVEIGQGLTVVTGVSGSGKTSLVFDTLYHEARRRFLECFAPASSRLRLSPARVQSITGLGPAVAVGQNLLNRNPGSTLATASGLHPFFRLLYARFGVRDCALCSEELMVWSADEIVAQLVKLVEIQAVEIYAPLLRGVPGSHHTLLELLAQEFGGHALRLDGQIFVPGETTVLPDIAHDLDVLVARLEPDQGEADVVGEARAGLHRAAALGATSVMAKRGAEQRMFSRAPVCYRCGTWFGDLEPVHFHMACPHCSGKGCARCAGTGMYPEAAGVRWSGKRLPELLSLSVSEACALFMPAAGVESALSPTRLLPPRLSEEIGRRLEALLSVGLGYLSLDRPSPTLSRGEAQRVRLAVTLVSRLEDMLHVLDEPTVGLHALDVSGLMPVFRQLAGPVVYVEHDRMAAAVADQAIDLGPGAGSLGGHILFSGTPAGVWSADTPTGRYFSLRQHNVSPRRRPAPDSFLTIRGANLRNLRDIDVSIPLGRLTVITGVSGSGKSTLVEGVLGPTLESGSPIGCRAVEGPHLKPVVVDQSPIGINPRSNASTYTGLADIIRDLFAAATGLTPSHFSFNRPEGACPACKGMGAIEVNMRYLPSSWIECADCQGQRFSDEVLAARVKLGERWLSIADFYRLPVGEILPLLVESPYLPKAKRKSAIQIVSALIDVGLGYLVLGQPSLTLSGGEAQRVKLTRYLGKGMPAGGSGSPVCLLLDEPSTGLHPQDVSGLLIVLDRLVREGATVVVVEHNLDIIRVADWVIDLGPGAGPAGGRLLYAGPPEELPDMPESPTGRALREEGDVQPNAVPKQVKRDQQQVSISEAWANNLQHVSVNFPKGRLSVVTGVSGSGKSSLVGDVLEAEARRRFLESLSMYERQQVREGPEAPVGAVSGLGVSVRIRAERVVYDRRATVGTASELSHHLAMLLSFAGERDCPDCHKVLQRVSPVHPHGQRWLCPACSFTAPVGEPRHFLPTQYAAACLNCQGVGTIQVPAPHKLIIFPDKPLCAGAMYSPGFFPKGYLGKPGNGGYDLLQALAARYHFDPFTTSWDEMAPEAQQAFLHGDSDPMPVNFFGRNRRTRTMMCKFPGFYGWVRDWDTGGTYTDTQPCPACGGSGLREEYAGVTLGGKPVHALNTMPLIELAAVLQSLPLPEDPLTGASLQTARLRLNFLNQVGLGYLHLDRPTGTLSAGEAQRIRLAGLLGSQLTSLTVLLDEPSRGLHPAEVESLLEALRSLCDEGNTVIVVEHEPLFMLAADYLVDMGPGSGTKGGRIVAQGTPESVLRTAGPDSLTAAWLRGERHPGGVWPRRAPREDRWLRILGARGHNLQVEEVRIPLGLLVGVCGVSGSGKSTLVIDTLGRALAPRKHTTSVAREPLDAEAYDDITGAPDQVVLLDQTRAGMHSPADFLGLVKPLIALFAESEAAHALSLTEDTLARRCSACGGSGVRRMDMVFLPPVDSTCETCRGTGFLPEAWLVSLGGQTLPETFSRTIDEVYDMLCPLPAEQCLPDYLLRTLAAARQVGLGYLTLNQPGNTLSGGEAQRLKIASKLCASPSRKKGGETLYILDEPTVGQHLEDVERLAGVLHHLVETGNSVLVVEHHPHLLAACDWLVELGPGGGPQGGRVIASGRPEEIAPGETPIAPYLAAVLAERAVLRKVT